MVKNFEEKFKELRVEGHRKEPNSSTSVMFAEEDDYMDEDDVEMEEEEDLDASDEDLDSQGEVNEKEILLFKESISEYLHSASSTTSLLCTES